MVRENIKQVYVKLQENATDTKEMKKKIPLMTNLHTEKSIARSDLQKIM